MLGISVQEPITDQSLFYHINNDLYSKKTIFLRIIESIDALKSRKGEQ